MSNVELSVIIPSIRVENLTKIYFFLEKAIEPYSFELIVVGPYAIPDELWNKENIKEIKDFGSPSRCVQLASSIADGKYMMWLSDDLTFLTPQSLSQCIQLFESNKISDKDAVCLRYFEGEGVNEFAENYWYAWTHEDQRLAGINKEWKIAPLGMYNTSYFRELGGLDCIHYEHINMCTHDLAFRLQQNGGKIHLSPQSIARFYWSWPGPDAKPIQDAYFLNDKSAYKEMYNKDQSDRIKIDYWNWTQVDNKWKRRFGEK